MTPIWLFDLDNTLHNASAHIFPHINRAMTAYLEQHLALGHDEANRLRVHYWHRYGATLLGLVRHHGTDPHHFLAETHRFDQLHRITVFDHALDAMLRRLPGRKLVVSNGPKRYVDAVLDVMGVRRHFDASYGIEQLDFHPKPAVKAFRTLIARERLSPRRCILVEDSADNLRTAKRLGMRTVLVGKGCNQTAFVDMRIDNVLDLRRAAARLGA